MADILDRLAAWRQLTPEHRESVADKARFEIERLRAALQKIADNNTACVVVGNRIDSRQQFGTYLPSNNQLNTMELVKIAKDALGNPSS